MLKVYNNMGIALAVSGFVSFFTANSPALMQAIFGSPLQWLACQPKNLRKQLRGFTADLRYLHRRFNQKRATETIGEVH